MKVVLFCGGAGMRLREYAEDIPKPMVPIGTRPILWHLMKYYAHFGHEDFIVCLGHRGDVIKNYFLNYDESASNDFVWSRGGKEISYLNRDLDNWRITFVETGVNSPVGERLRRVEPFLRGEEQFLANYGDGLSDLPLPRMIDEFQQSRAIAAMLLVQPTATFDFVNADPQGTVTGIQALHSSQLWINGGFFVLRREIFEYLRPGEELVREPFQRLIEKKALLGHRYGGFWQCMDTFKDKQHLEDLNSVKAPWKVWETEDGAQDKSVDLAAGA